MGCTSEVFMTASLDKQNRVQFAGDSDSELTRGLCSVLVQGMSGLTPAEVLQVSPLLIAVYCLLVAASSPERQPPLVEGIESCGHQSGAV